MRHISPEQRLDEIDQELLSLGQKCVDKHLEVRRLETEIAQHNRMIYILESERKKYENTASCSSTCGRRG